MKPTDSGWHFRCPCGWEDRDRRHALDDLRARVRQHSADHRSQIDRLLSRARRRASEGDPDA